MNDIEKYDHLRMERNRLLRDTDFMFCSDYLHKTETIKNQWIIYRQSLRDLPSNININDVIFDMDSIYLISGITWPDKPSS
mgnify:FL=1